MGRIVVGVDESAAAATALVWAVEDARAKSWSVRAVMCWDYLGQHHASGRPAGFDPHYDEAAATADLEALVTRAVGRVEVPIEHRVVLDLPTRGLLEAAQDADVLVVGARGSGGFETLLLGSTSDQLLRHAPIPVVAVRPRDEQASDAAARIVVGVDGSEGSRRALAWAVEQARARTTALEVIRAWNRPALELPRRGDDDPLEDAAQATVDEAIAGAKAGGLTGAVSGRAVSADASDALLDAAADAALVVVGARGLGRFRELLLGSVSHRVATHARCSVAVIPPPDRKLEVKT